MEFIAPNSPNVGRQSNGRRVELVLVGMSFAVVLGDAYGLGYGPDSLDAGLALAAYLRTHYGLRGEVWSFRCGVNVKYMLYDALDRQATYHTKQSPCLVIYIGRSLPDGTWLIQTLPYHRETFDFANFMRETGTERPLTLCTHTNQIQDQKSDWVQACSSGVQIHRWTKVPSLQEWTSPLQLPPPIHSPHDLPATCLKEVSLKDGYHEVSLKDGYHEVSLKDGYHEVSLKDGYYGDGGHERRLLKLVQASNFVWVEGDIGVGKTALFAHLVAPNPPPLDHQLLAYMLGLLPNLPLILSYANMQPCPETEELRQMIVAHHFCVCSHPQSLSPTLFLRNLQLQLGQRPSGKQYGGLAEEMVKEILEPLSRCSRSRRIILVDGLDSSHYDWHDPANSILSLLTDHRIKSAIPTNVTLLCSSRHMSHVSHNTNWGTTYEMGEERGVVDWYFREGIERLPVLPIGSFTNSLFQHLQQDFSISADDLIHCWYDGRDLLLAPSNSSFVFSGRPIITLVMKRQVPMCPGSLKTTNEIQTVYLQRPTITPFKGNFLDAWYWLKSIRQGNSTDYRPMDLDDHYTTALKQMHIHHRWSKIVASIVALANLSSGGKPMTIDLLHYALLYGEKGDNSVRLTRQQVCESLDILRPLVSSDENGVRLRGSNIFKEWLSSMNFHSLFSHDCRAAEWQYQAALTLPPDASFEPFVDKPGWIQRLQLLVSFPKELKNLVADYLLHSLHCPPRPSFLTAQWKISGGIHAGFGRFEFLPPHPYHIQQFLGRNIEKVVQWRLCAFLQWNPKIYQTPSTQFIQTSDLIMNIGVVDGRSLVIAIAHMSPNEITDDDEDLMSIVFREADCTGNWTHITNPHALNFNLFDPPDPPTLAVAAELL